MRIQDVEGEIRTSKDMAHERDYTEQEIDEMWHLDRKTVHKMFDGQPGVLEFGTEGRTLQARTPQPVDP